MPDSHTLAHINTLLDGIDHDADLLRGKTILRLNAQQRQDIDALLAACDAFAAQFKTAAPTLADADDAAYLKRLRHDLRNHLNLMAGFSKVLQREIPPPFTPSQFNALQQIHSHSRALLELVERLH